MIELQPMSGDTFEERMRRSKRRLAEERARIKGTAIADEERSLDAMMAQLLPDGVETPGQAFRTIVAVETGASVGFVWYGTMPGRTPGTRFLFDIEIDLAHRRRGYAFAALRAVIGALRTDGALRLDLEVRGENAAARALYAKLGFRATNVQMSVPLGPNA